MVDIHGLLLCGGNGTRFAESVGKKDTLPYPKHLERIGEATILERSITTMIENIGVSAITVMINPELHDIYVGELRYIQTLYPRVAISYSKVAIPHENNIRPNLHHDLKSGIYDLNEKKIEIGDPFIAFAHGDAIFLIPEHEQLQETIFEYVSEKRHHEDITIYMGSFLGAAFLYHLDRLSNLSDDWPNEIMIGVHHYGETKAWNINRVADLIEAKKGLGYILTEDEELKITEPTRPHKES